MNLIDYENQMYGDLWNEKTLKELKEYEPPENTGTIEQQQYECYFGRYIPDSFFW